MGRLEGRVAVVTGGAAGIGAATVRRFAREGASVVCADIDDEAATLLAETARADGLAVEFAHADVAELADVEAAVALAVDRFGGLDVLHNNAFWTGGGYLHEITADDWDRSLRVCLTGVWHGIKAAVPAMIERGGGSIVNMSSIDGLFGERFAGPYAAAKAAILNLTRVAANEYGRVGIRVNAICPGAVDTRALELLASFLPGYLADVAEAAALGRIISPDELANVVLFLASDESSAITGAAIVADAGLTIRHPAPTFPPFQPRV